VSQVHVSRLLRQALDSLREAAEPTSEQAVSRSA